jgi:hypothetical protein
LVTEKTTGELRGVWRKNYKVGGCKIMQAREQGQNRN